MNCLAGSYLIGLVVKIFTNMKYSSTIFQEGDKQKDKKDPPKYPCHMCDIPVMFALTALRYYVWAWA